MTPHCRDISLEEGEIMLGTAPSHECYLVLEAAFPWQHDILETKDLAGFRHVLMQLGIKVHLIGSDPEYTRQGLRTVLFFQRNGVEFTTQEFLVPQGREEVVLPAIAEGLAQAYLVSENRRHILVCVDGGHDICCGRWGQPCYAALRAALTEPDVRVWRSSHIGGHRFAPTAADFPEGRYYGRLKENAPDLLRKTIPFDPEQYRGNSCFPRDMQAQEAALLEKEGWGADIRLLRHDHLQNCGF